MYDPQTLSLAEAAEFLHLGVDHTRKLFDSGELPGLSLNQKHIVFLRSDLIAFIREHAQHQTLARKQATRKIAQRAEAKEWAANHRQKTPARTAFKPFDLTQYDEAHQA